MKVLQFKNWLIKNNIPFDETENPYVLQVDEEDLRPYYDKLQKVFPEFKPYQLEAMENQDFAPKESTD